MYQVYHQVSAHIQKYTLSREREILVSLLRGLRITIIVMMGRADENVYLSYCGKTRSDILTPLELNLELAAVPAR